MKEAIRNNMNGILGTIIFHLIAVIIILSFKIGDMRKRQEVFVIDFAKELKEIEKVLEEQKPEFKELPELSGALKRNIAVNVENEIGKEISTENYEQEIMKELGIDELKQTHDRNIDEGLIISENKEKEEKKEKKEEYSGPTTVSYSLKGRNKIYLPLPIYKCQGGGEVIINIIVNQQGQVINADVSNSKSGTTNPCLVEAATNAAYKSVFNASIKSEPKQKGYISYQFIPQ